MLYYSTLRDADPKVREGIWNLMCQCDSDFYPPLSVREPTDSIMCGTGVSESKPYTFFDMVQDMSVIVDDECVGAVIGFYEDYVLDDVDDVPRTYVMFILVSPECRGRGMGRMLYNEMLGMMEGKGKGVCTRTWSTNYAHLALARSLGLVREVILENDRGNGVDTVYLVKDEVC